MTATGLSGFWPSLVSPQMLVSGAAAPGEIRADGGDIWWSESRPDEGGRVQLVRRSADGTIADMLPTGYSARTRVHEYGGGAWAVADQTVVFANFEDQRLYRLDTTSAGKPVPITPDPREHHGLRFADPAIVSGDVKFAVRNDEQTVDSPGVTPGTEPSPDGRVERWVVAVAEFHGDDRPQRPEDQASPDEAANQVVAIPLGNGVADDTPWQTLNFGTPDPAFVASPTVSRDGRVAAISWDHPNMPWDDTRLAAWSPSGGLEFDLAAGVGVARISPQWAPDGTLTFLSDETGWWNPYRWNPADESVTALAPVDAEIGGPLWVFGLRYLAWLPDGRFVCSLTRDGFDHLAVGSGDGRAPLILDTPFTHISQVVPGPSGSVLVVAGAPAAESAPYRVMLGSASTEGSVAPLVEIERLRPARDLGLGANPSSWFSAPVPITVPTSGGATTHALLYRPKNPTSAVDTTTKPPLLVLGHGGPTSAARAQLNLATQFWTSRGFCVADVNYRGSTGFGRPYRDLLQGQWGIADVEDCVAVAAYLVSAGEVDGSRLAIRGGSAGGFTTLAALTFHDTFTAGSSHYGIADLEVLATDTHKFESRYLDGLVGPWPDHSDVYQARSPIHHIDGLSCPVAIFQGADDEVVPPAQAALIVDAMRAKGLPYAAIVFEGEGHGFRQAANIVRSIEGELWFYSRVFEIALDELIEPLPGQGLA